MGTRATASYLLATALSRALGLTLLVTASGCLEKPGPTLSPAEIDRLCRREPLPPELYGEKAPSPGSEPPAGAVLLPAPAGDALLAIDTKDPAYRLGVPAHCMPAERVVATVRICVDEAGAVTQTRLLQGSRPTLDGHILPTLARWRYRPYLLDGRATPFCYHVNYSAGEPTAD